MLREIIIFVVFRMACSVSRILCVRISQNLRSAQVRRITCEMERAERRASRRLDDAIVHIENSHHVAEAVFDGLGEQGKVVGALRNDLADHLAVLKA